MHKSRVGGFIVACQTQTDDLDTAANFRSEALGAPIRRAADPGKSPCVELDISPARPYVEVQAVAHDSRVDLDIETDDVAAEVRRLETPGAPRAGANKDWIVMAAPTGQRFCVVPVVGADFVANANAWSSLKL